MWHPRPNASRWWLLPIGTLAVAGWAMARLPGARRPTVESADPGQPPGLFLTWQRDPSTTMTVDWHVDPGHRRHRPDD